MSGPLTSRLNPWTNPHARRPAKTGSGPLNIDGVPNRNNNAEREIPPAVLMRKADYGSGTDKGAETQSVLMSICRTLNQRGPDPPTETETDLLQFMKAGREPPLPTKISSGG